MLLKVAPDSTDVHQIMMASSNGDISALLILGVGNSPIAGEFPSQRPVTWSFDFFLWSAPEQTVETIEAPVIWDVIALIVTSL